MKIKKIGHCCLLIKTNKLTILTDPGAFSVEQNSIKGIDVLLITHEHFDHLHTTSVQEIVKNNPNIKIVTNSSVGRKLDEQGITYFLLQSEQRIEIENVSIEAYDCKHEEIFEDVAQVQNTAYLIDGRLLFPGDSYFNPNKAIDILALPVAGPWCKIPDALRYALLVKPKKAFPIHDGMLQKDRIGGAHKVPEKILSENGIEFMVMNDGDECDF